MPLSGRTGIIRAEAGCYVSRMDRQDEQGRKRRELMSLGTAALLAAVIPARCARADSGEAATPAATVRKFVELRARLDGKPVFSIARGTDEAIAEGAAVPLRGQIIIQITRAIDLGGGDWELPYVEGTLTTEPGTFRYQAELANPLTHETRHVAGPGAYLARLRMDRRGVLDNHVELPGGTTIDYAGRVAAESGLENRPWATQSLRIRIARPAAEIEEAFVTTTMMQTGTSRRGFTPSDTMSNSLRPKLPSSLGGGRSGSLVSTFYGRKYPTLDALHRTMDPGHPARFAPLFDQWHGLLP